MTRDNPVNAARQHVSERRTSVSNPVGSMSARDIDEIIRKNEADEREQREAELADRRAISDAYEERKHIVEGARREVARDLGVDPRGLADAIALRKAPGPLLLAWEALASITHFDLDGIVLDGVRAARHALAHAKVLPPVRRDDGFFGSSKALRDLPRPSLEIPHIADLTFWLEPLARAFALPVPQQAEPDCEAPAETHERTQRLHDTGKYDRKDEDRSRQLRDQDRDLAAQRYSEAARACRTAHRNELLELRTRICDALDLALASRDVDVAWFYAREMRRYVTGESRRITSYIEPVLHAALSLGFKLSADTTH